MKKNITFIAVIIILSSRCLINGQDTVAFATIQNSTIKCPSLKDTFALELTFKFDRSYKAHKIAFFKSSTPSPETRLSETGTFDDDIGRSNEVGNPYFIAIKKDRLISFTNEEGIPANVDSFYLQFDGQKICGPFRLHKSKNIDKPTPEKDYQPGYLFFDALELIKLKKEADDKGIKKILSNYGISDTTVLNKNPYLADVFADVFKRSAGEVQSGGGIGSFASSVGGLDVTKYANAIADIMIERAKQELTIAFFNRFKKFAEDNPEFGILFPKTTDNLSKLLSYTYPQMLPALRDGFFEDLKQITYRLDDVLDLPRYQKLLKNFPEARIAIRSLRIVHELETGASNAADIIKEFSSFKEWTDDESSAKIKNVGSCLKISALFSESIRNDTSRTHTNDVWVPAKELKQVFYDETLFRIYIGLLYQRSIIDTLKYFDANGTEKNFSDLLGKQKDNLFLSRINLKSFLI